MSEVPPDFDWVSARAKCAAADMFENLRQLAKTNVDQRNAFREPHAKGDRFYLRDSSYGRRFTVDDSYGYSRRSVDFHLKPGDVIAVLGLDATQNFNATLTLNDKGECKFKVNGDELDPWQLLKRALEPLFFGPLEG